MTVISRLSIYLVLSGIVHLMKILVFLFEVDIFNACCYKA